MKSIDIREWADEIYDTDDLDSLEVEMMTRVTDGQPLEARQRLELYWEQKRLEDNLFDVLADDGFCDIEPLPPANVRQDSSAIENHI